MECAEDKVGFFVVADVLSGLFAKFGHVAEAVEQVVLQLEGETQVNAEFI